MLSIGETHRLLPHEELSLMSIVSDHMRAEAEHTALRMMVLDAADITDSSNGNDSSAGREDANRLLNISVAAVLPLNTDDKFFLARGLRVFDADFHAVSSIVFTMLLLTRIERHPLLSRSTPRRYPTW